MTSSVKLLSLLVLICVVFVLLLFFFSSRRRHTRCLSDWSSDVCSSDLVGPASAPYTPRRSTTCRRSAPSGNRVWMCQSFHFSPLSAAGRRCQVALFLHFVRELPLDCPIDFISLLRVPLRVDARCHFFSTWSANCAGSRYFTVCRCSQYRASSPSFLNTS